jgi:2-dehydro-3-deoxyphosphooctonate aldolase (KDO 8-P synthase)
MIVDFRGIPTMQHYASTVLDVTHSCSNPTKRLVLQAEDQT